MKINSDTHKIVVVPKSYLFLSEGGKEEYELLPEKYWLKFLMAQDDSIVNLNFMWLLERGYLISPPESYTIGIPTLSVENIKRLIVFDDRVWECDCKSNPLHVFDGKNCEECDVFASNSQKCSYIKPEQIWGPNWEKPEFTGSEFFLGGVRINPEEIMKKNKYSANRELLYRMPPQNLWEVISHTIKGTIFSPFKKITRKEVENHASKFFSI